MSLNIESFGIRGLYGNRDYSIKFTDNQLVLVGENGTGKSTVVSILHYFLTSQWKKLRNYDFRDIELRINGREYILSRDEIEAFKSFNINSHFLRRFQKRLDQLGISPEEALSSSYGSRSFDTTFELFYDSLPGNISPARAKHMLKQLLNRQSDFFEDEDTISKKLIELESKLSMNVLYLPTYRRIERDLKTIFPDLEEDLTRFNKKINPFNQSKGHLELVEFGMGDVLNMIKTTMKSLDSSFRASLNELTGGYLKVILRKEYEEADISLLEGINESYLEEILKKIDESILSGDEQKTLRETIKRFAEIEKFSEIDKLSAHIITKLILLHKNQYEREEKVRAFTSVCNKYLKGKRFEFDSNTFSLPIKPYDDSFYGVASNETEIDLSMLSSGEKQIVSLFSHLYLSDIDDYFVIIDEPELSLSVPWQKSFLPDMLDSKKCSGLVAVTHSPFIYANELDSKVHSIEEFVRISEV